MQTTVADHAPVCNHDRQMMQPAALCSVNLRFPVPGYGDAQATGRGATPQEAARNLRATMDATREALAPEPEPTREEKLAQLLSKCVLKATQRGDFEAVTRLAKAYALAAKGYVDDPTNRAGEWCVRSERDPQLWYTINTTEHGMLCSCPDAGYNPERPCKHQLAVHFHSRIAQQDCEESPRG